MKEITLLIYIILGLHYYGKSQNCIPTASVFNSQAQVDAFPLNYPGCTAIDGNVGITGKRFDCKRSPRAMLQNFSSDYKGDLLN